MRDELLQYYERELAFLRHMGARFAEEYPKVAGRLQLEPNKCEDPHVERLAARVRELKQATGLNTVGARERATRAAAE